MTLHGHVHNGSIVFDKPLALPEGASVQVKIIVADVAAGSQSMAEDPLPTLAERLQSFIGCLEGLPDDAAINHDHYLYGAPKGT